MVHLDGLTCTDSDSGDSGSEPESCNESEESYTIHSEDGVSVATYFLLPLAHIVPLLFMGSLLY